MLLTFEKKPICNSGIRHAVKNNPSYHRSRNYKTVKRR
jgi:hypothetical protein